MSCETAGFGGDLGVDLRRRPVAVFEGVVLVVELGEPSGQGQVVPMAVVDAAYEVPRYQLAGEHAACECPRGGSPTGLVADRVEGEAEFAECLREQFGYVVVRLGACAGGQDAQGGAVESGDERVTGGADDVGRADSPTLQRAAWSCRALAADSAGVTRPLSGG